MIAATIYVEQKEYAADWRLSISLEGSAAMTFGFKTGKGGRGGGRVTWPTWLCL